MDSSDHGMTKEEADRPQTQASLRKSEEHFRRLMEESPLPIQVLDAAGKIIHMNKAWKELWYTLAGDYAGEFDLLQHEEVLVEMELMGPIRRAFAGEQTVFPDFEFEPQRFGLNGRKRWLRGRAYGLKDNQGRLLNVVFILEDITVSRESAIKLNEASKRLAVLREIDQAILAAQSPQEIAEAALSRIRQLVPCQRASVVLFDWETEIGMILAAEDAMETPVSLPQFLPISSFMLPESILQERKITTFSLTEEAEMSLVEKTLWTIGIRSVTAVPLIASGQLIGVLYLGWNKKGPFFSFEHQEIGQQIATQLAIAIQQARLLAAEKTRRQEAETLRTVTSTIVSTLELDQVLTLILQQLRLVLAFDSATIFLWEDDMFRAVAELGLPHPEEVVGKTFPGGDPLSHEMRTMKKPILIADAQKDERFQEWGKTSYVRGWMGVPLLVRGRFIGHMTVDSLEPGAYKPAHASLILPFANQAAQAIENARLYDAVQHHAQELEQIVRKLRETQQRLVQQERLAAVGQLAAGIAHDFNNILAVIVLYTQLLQRTADLRPGEQQRLQTIVEQSRRATHLIQQILDFSRQSMIEKRPLALVPYLKEIEKLLQRTLPETIHVRFQHDDKDYLVYADATSLQQLMMNLAVNSRDAMPEGGELHLSLAEVQVTEPEPMGPVDLPPGQWVLLRVSDTGHGMPHGVQKHIFEPFFTTKPTGEGTGLGLAQAYGIVKQHAGFIFCDSEVDQGATFRIYLPAISQVEAPVDVGREAPPQGAGETVLLVEDSDLTRTALLDILQALNYQVITAVNGVEAKAILAQNSAIDLVISDVVMPEMGGVALANWLKEHYPGIKLLLMTGYAMDKRDELARRRIPWIQKPFTVDRLAEKLAEIFA